ncbi:MAG TPA: DUF998 domain-containing protein [Methylomirabilota bacterium]|nr:DUF998 domain-containing protein [Methylomirabilota bacterium]
MTPYSPSDPNLVLSYLGLRKAVGIIGIALPFVLAFGRMLLEGPGIRTSISSYYHTAMGDVFVGSLCAIGVFMISYRGYERVDDIAGDLACVFAIGTALFPTTPDLNITSRDRLVGSVHWVCAALLFLTLAFFSLALFRKTDPRRPPTRRKRQRNVVYTVCGYTMLACLALIGVVALLPDTSPVRGLAPIFWLEASAVVAFGISWLTKGEAILKDD